MFQTNNSAEVHIPKPLALSSERLWSWVSLPIHIPLYFVSLRTEGESGTFDRMFFVSNLDHIGKLTRQSLGHVTGVQLISPKWLNGEGDWLMESLHEILQGKCPEGRPATVYVLGNGKRYIDTEAGVSEEHLSGVETVFSLRSKSH